MSRSGASEEELDLVLAAELQAALLPKKCPHDCPHQVAAARNRMCRGVGGDFYDLIRINDEQIALVIGDVVGHGVRASLLMAQIMGLLRSDTAGLSRPGQTVTVLNRMLIDLGERIGSVVPCSMFYAVIDTPTGIGFFINAGHPRPLLCDRNTDTVRHLGSRDMLLGVEDFQPEEVCHTFTPGQRLIMYTDGVIEAGNIADEQFGLTRLHEVVSRCAAGSPEECADAVFQAVDGFRNGAEQEDDETIVVVDRV